jgi:hypothetical protein
MRRLILLACALLLLAGCRSRVIVVSTINTGDAPIRNLEMQYPGGSFGVATLLPGHTHEYRIKPFRTGDLLVQYLDAAGSPRKYVGPRLHKDDEGRISITISAAGTDVVAGLH